MDKKARLSDTRRVARGALRRAARLGGYHVVPADDYDIVRRHFYSPLPDLDGLPPGLFTEPSPLLGVDLQLDEARDLVAQLVPYFSEFASLLAVGAFDIKNTTYGPIDADTLYAMLRHFKPARVVELGSGSSTHVIALARARNTQEDRPFEHTAFDPYPWKATSLGIRPGVAVEPLGAADVPVEIFRALQPNDVLFVDTTHTVKTSGDVNRIILDILPELRPGVHIHFHDIFLPFEYPRYWVVDERRALAEQYLLQAFLGSSLF
jgi:hypothetical protein